MIMEQNWNCLLFALKNIFSFDLDGRVSIMFTEKEKKEKRKDLDHICSLQVYQNEKLCQI